MRVLRGNRTFFFLDGFIETRTKNGGFTCWFGVRTWNLWWFHWNRGFLVKLEAEGLQLHQNTPGFDEYHHRFSSSYSKPTREYRHFFVRVLMNTVKKKIKNMCVFPMKPFICYFSTKFLPMNTINFQQIVSRFHFNPYILGSFWNVLW